MTFNDATRVLGKDPLQYGALGLLGIGILAVLWSGQHQAKLESSERIQMQENFDERSSEVSSSIDDLRDTIMEMRRQETADDSRRAELVLQFMQSIKTCQEQEADLSEPGPKE